MRESRADLDLIQVEAYLMDEYDVTVSFDEDGLDEYWFDERSFPEDKGHISIDSRNDLEYQLYVLLHEAGHVFLRADQEKFSIRFPDSSRLTESGRIEILKEEVAAWSVALDIAEELGITVDMERWKKNYRDALKKYVVWIYEEDSDEE